MDYSDSDGILDCSTLLSMLDEYFRTVPLDNFTHILLPKKNSPFM